MIEQVRIRRNWANQEDPKSDLVQVYGPSQELYLLMSYLMREDEHFHYFSDSPNDGSITASGKAVTKWVKRVEPEPDQKKAQSGFENWE